MLLFPERLKRRHCGMQSEKAVEVEHGFPGDVDGRTHGVVTGLAVGYDDVEAVGCCAGRSLPGAWCERQGRSRQGPRASKSSAAWLCQLRLARRCGGKYVL